MLAIPAAVISQYYKTQQQLLKRSSRHVSYCYMFRNRVAIFTDYDETIYGIQHTKLVIVSSTLKHFNILKHKIT